MSDLRPCCQIPENREPRPDHPDAKNGVTVAVCTVCGAKHLLLSVDPGELGLLGKGL